MVAPPNGTPRYPASAICAAGSSAPRTSRYDAEPGAPTSYRKLMKSSEPSSSFRPSIRPPALVVVNSHSPPPRITRRVWAAGQTARSASPLEPAPFEKYLAPVDIDVAKSDQLRVGSRGKPPISFRCPAMFICVGGVAGRHRRSPAILPRLRFRESASNVHVFGRGAAPRGPGARGRRADIHFLGRFPPRKVGFGDVSAPPREAVSRPWRRRGARAPPFWRQFRIRRRWSRALREAPMTQS